MINEAEFNLLKMVGNLYVLGSPRLQNEQDQREFKQRTDPLMPLVERGLLFYSPPEYGGVIFRVSRNGEQAIVEYEASRNE